MSEDISDFQAAFTFDDVPAATQRKRHYTPRN